ncbi:hypothetical protein JCM3770_000587 [Rhodotorula araucariae]
MEADGELWDTVEKPVASAQDWLNRSEALAANSDWVRMAKVLRAVELERLATTMTVAARRLVVVGLGNYTHPLTRHSVGQVLLKNLAKRAAASPARLAGTATLLAVKVGRHTSWTTRITLSPPPTCANQTPLEVLFVLPKALMNISGPTVVAALDGFLPPLAAPSRPAPVPSAEEPTQFPARRKKAPPAPLKPMYRLLTLQDDLDLAPSHVKSQRGGGPRGHNGVRSLASALRGSRDFHRLWIGIGRPAERNEVADYVLRPLSRDEVRFEEE